MKRILLLISILCLALSSCDKADVDDIFDKSPEQRVVETVNEVRTDLMSNEMGWITTYVYNEGKTEKILLIKFLENDRAEITIPEDGNEKYKSSYRLSFTQQLDLVFDSYSFLSTLVDGDKKGDFRWELRKKEDGKYFFTSFAQGAEGASEMVIEKASKEKLKVALKIQSLKEKLRPNLKKSFFRNLEIGGKKYAYSYNTNKVIFTKLKDDELVSYKGDITVTENGFTFNSPLTIDGVNLEEFEYSETDESFKLVKPAGTDAKIVYGAKPFAYPNGVKLFNDNPRHYYNVTTYSAKLKEALDDLKKKDPAFQFLQIYVDYPLGKSSLNELDYYRGSVNPRWIGFKMNFIDNGVDEVTFKFAGASTTAVNYYKSSCALSFNMFWDKTFIVVPSKDGVILVQKNDPSIWMVANHP